MLNACGCVMRNAHHRHHHHHRHILFINTQLQTIGNKTKTDSQKILRSSELKFFWAIALCAILFGGWISSKTINHSIMFHLPSCEVRWYADVSDYCLSLSEWQIMLSLTLAFLQKTINYVELIFHWSLLLRYVTVRSQTGNFGDCCGRLSPVTKLLTASKHETVLWRITNDSHAFTHMYSLCTRVPIS